MSCQLYEELIMRLPDGDLSEAEKRALTAHLTDCPRCMALYEALMGAERELHADVPVPPALRSGVMDRVLAWEGEQDAPVDIHEQRRRRSPWRGLLVAACLLIILGGGSYIGMSLFGHKTTAVSESAVLEQSVLLGQNEAPLAPMPEPEEAEAAAAGAAMMFSDAAPMEEAAAAEADIPELDGGEAAASRAAFTVDAPASVLPGREGDFEALLSDAGGPGDGTPQELQVIAAAEYRGVIYEFSADPSGSRLYWRDAAEGVTPILSPADPSALWACIG